MIVHAAISLAVLGQWDDAEAWAKQVGRDPTGLVPVVLSAAALRRGDESVLETWEAQDGGDAAMPIREQVEMGVAVRMACLDTLTRGIRPDIEVASEDAA